MTRIFLLAGAAAAFVGVAAGAFGAHALETRFSAEQIAVFETGVRYQMYHALALVAVGIAGARWPDPLWTATGWLFVVGIAVFSGSLYALVLSGARWLGAVTPVGGLCLLAGWACATVAAWRGVG